MKRPPKHLSQKLNKINYINVKNIGRYIEGKDLPQINSKDVSKV